MVKEPELEAGQLNFLLCSEARHPQFLPGGEAMVPVFPCQAPGGLGWGREQGDIAERRQVGMRRDDSKHMSRCLRAGTRCSPWPLEVAVTVIPFHRLETEAQRGNKMEDRP